MRNSHQVKKKQPCVRQWLWLRQPQPHWSSTPTVALNRLCCLHPCGRKYKRRTWSVALFIGYKCVSVWGNCSRVSRTYRSIPVKTTMQPSKSKSNFRETHPLILMTTTRLMNHIINCSTWSTNCFWVNWTDMTKAMKRMTSRLSITKVEAATVPQP